MDKILNLCAQPISFDELLEQSALEEAVLLHTLCELSLEGKIAQNRVGLWSLR